MLWKMSPSIKEDPKKIYGSPLRIRYLTIHSERERVKDIQNNEKRRMSNKKSLYIISGVRFVSTKILY